MYVDIHNDVFLEKVSPENEERWEFFDGNALLFHDDKLFSS
jgi:hypothetical protein